MPTPIPDPSHDSSGPAERALARLLAAEPGLTDALDETPAAIEPCDKPGVGDLKIDLGAALPGERSAAKTACAELSARIARLAAIDKSTPIPPRAYVTVSLAALQDWVVAGILAAPDSYGTPPAGAGRRIVVSFLSPNANKPLHLGHMRNIFLGMAMANTAAACGYDVTRTAILSDWGVHICQAALAYDRWGKGATPEDHGVKSDVLAGDSYVRFHREVARCTGGGAAALKRDALQLLRGCENGDPAAQRSQQRIVDWAWAGIEQTCRRLATRIDRVFRESESLAGARGLIEDALRAGRCMRRSDGSVYARFDRDELDDTTLLRSDGSAVAYTQVLGAYAARHREIRPQMLFAMCGKEWELGMTIVLELLGGVDPAWPEQIEIVYYGMVSLSGGKMKSREGTVVEADGLMDTVTERLLSGWTGAGPPPAARRTVCDALGIGLLKYHFLRSARDKDVHYDADAVWRRTLPSYAQIIRTMAWSDFRVPGAGGALVSGAAKGKGRRVAHRKLLLSLNDFPRSVARALRDRNPAHVLRSLDDVCGAAARAGLRPDTDPAQRPLCDAITVVLRRGLGLMNIELPAALDQLPPGFRPPVATSGR